jgi:hypothetical protein
MGKAEASDGRIRGEVTKWEIDREAMLVRLGNERCRRARKDSYSAVQTAWVQTRGNTCITRHIHTRTTPGEI